MDYIVALYILGALIMFVIACRWGAEEIDWMPWLAGFQRRDYVYTAIIAALIWPAVLYLTLSRAK